MMRHDHVDHFFRLYNTLHVLPVDIVVSLFFVFIIVRASFMSLCHCHSLPQAFFLSASLSHTLHL